MCSWSNIHGSRYCLHTLLLSRAVFKRFQDGQCTAKAPWSGAINKKERFLSLSALSFVFPKHCNCWMKHMKELETVAMFWKDRWMVSSVNTLGVVFGDMPCKKNQKALRRTFTELPLPSPQDNLASLVVSSSVFLQKTRAPGSSLVSWCKSVAPEAKGSPAGSKFAWGYWITKRNGSLAQGL